MLLRSSKAGTREKFVEDLLADPRAEPLGRVVEREPAAERRCEKDKADLEDCPEARRSAFQSLEPTTGWQAATNRFSKPLPGDNGPFSTDTERKLVLDVVKTQPIACSLGRRLASPAAPTRPSRTRRLAKRTAK